MVWCIDSTVQKVLSDTEFPGMYDMSYRPYIATESEKLFPWFETNYTQSLKISVWESLSTCLCIYTQELGTVAQFLSHSFFLFECRKDE